MKNKISMLILFISAIIIFPSCSYRLVDFTIISSKNVSFKIDKSNGRQVSGTSMGFLGLSASVKDAMDKALQSAGADYDMLIDGVVRVVSYPFVSGYKVEGLAISTSKMRSMLGVKGFDEWCNAHNIFNPDKAKISN